NFRSGAFAQREWFLWRATHFDNSRFSKGDTILLFEEFYAWERSGEKMRISTRHHDERPFRELIIAKRWAEDGDKEHARELMKLVHANYQVDVNDQFYKAAMEALSDHEELGLNPTGTEETTGIL